jgi:hypothetical protein
MEQPRELHGNLLAAAGRARDQGRRLRHVVRHRETHAAQRLDPLGDGVHQLALFSEVLVEEEVELVERRPTDLPVVLLV